MSKVYSSKTMRDGNRIKLYKQYKGGITVDNYPQQNGGWTVHIFWPYSIDLSDKQKSFLDQYQMVYPKSFNGYQIRFRDWSTVTYDSIEMFDRMERLRHVVNFLRDIK